MSGAFDWSPGGCCCDGGGWFDLWSWDTLTTTGNFVRHTTLRPNGRSLFFDSDDPDAINWYMEPGGLPQVTSYGQTATGFPAFGPRVWVQAIRGAGSIGDTAHLILFDTVTRLPLFSLKTTFFAFHESNWLGSALSGVQTAISAVSQTKMASYGGSGQLTTCDDAGNLVTVPAAQQWPGPFPHNPTESVLFFAKRNWPDGIGSRLNGSTTSLIRGDVSVSGAFLRILDPQTVRSSSTSQLSWVSYDSSPTQWAGVIREVAGAVTSYHLYIDGALVKTLTSPVAYVPARGPFGEVHVCHPHEDEGIGDGWVAVPELHTSSGAIVDPNKPWRIIFYKNGAQNWILSADWPAQKDYPPRVAASGDRWVYIDDQQTLFASHQVVHTIPIPDHWKHDGSQHWRTGEMNAAFTTTIPDNGGVGGQFSPTTKLFPGYAGRTFYSVVQNSAAIGNALPANFPPS